MNKMFGIFILCILILPELIKAQVPTYNLTAKNFSRPSPNVLRFDIYVMHTNSPAVFEYSGGQYFFNFNPAIANGGILTYSYANDSSDLPSSLRPKNPQILGNQLRLSSNNFPGAGNGYIMTNNGNPGTKIANMQISTSAASFSHVHTGLAWRNSLPDPVTKLFAYVGTTNTNITAPATHSIDSSGIILTYNITLAIEGLLKTAFNVHNRKDTVTVFLTNAIPPYNILDTARAVIDSLNLSAAFIFRYAVNGTYYLVIKHHNSIETWSKEGGEVAAMGNTYNYDFTTDASKAYGNNLALRGSKYCLYSGDVNQDLVIDISDLSQVDNDVYNYAAGYRPTDLNGDFFVEGRDMNIIDNNRFRIVRNPIYGDIKRLAAGIQKFK